MVQFQNFEAAESLLFCDPGINIKVWNLWYVQWVRVYDDALIEKLYNDLGDDELWSVLEKCDVVDLFNFLKFDKRFEVLIKERWKHLVLLPSSLTIKIGVINLRNVLEIIGSSLITCTISFQSFKKITFDNSFEKHAILCCISKLTGQKLKKIELIDFNFTDLERQKYRQIFESRVVKIQSN